MSVEFKGMDGGPNMMIGYYCFKKQMKTPFMNNDLRLNDIGNRNYDENGVHGARMDVVTRGIYGKSSLCAQGRILADRFTGDAVSDAPGRII